MTWLWIILTAAGCLLVGFTAGVRYCGTRMLPVILAEMSDEELSDLAERSGRLRGNDDE